MVYIRKLQEQFALRKKQNTRYSLRAFARDLGLHASTLSKVLKGERGLPIADLEKVLMRLDLSSSEREMFFSSALQPRGFKAHRSKAIPVRAVKVLKNDLHFQILAEWEHYALLSLLKTKGFQSNVRWVSERLGISSKRTQKVVENLVQAEMLSEDENGQWVRQCPKLVSSDDTHALPLKISHQNDLKLAMTKLWDVPIDQRDFYSIMMPINPQNLKKAKKVTRSYIRQMEELLESGSQTEVYQLAVQLYPISIVTKKKVWKT